MISHLPASFMLQVTHQWTVHASELAGGVSQPFVSPQLLTKPGYVAAHLRWLRSCASKSICHSACERMLFCSLDRQQMYYIICVIF